MDSRKRAQIWLNSNVVDDETKASIQALFANPAELEDAFYKDLEFGTGGLRGVMGIGTNRMNKYTVGMATQGLSNYLHLQFPNQEIKVAIAHDSRIDSDYFTQIAADVFSANGIHVYLFPELRPTPELSFAIRSMGCQSGVVITASHNPKEYNGYKAYWTDGAQLITPHDNGVINEVRNITSFEQVNFSRNDSMLHPLGNEMDEAYLKSVKTLSRSDQVDKNVKIVYSSIHGAGITLVPRALEIFGFSHVKIVEDQSIPNGSFPTVIYPNPEEKEAMNLSIKAAMEYDADIVMATDPDADRVGVAVKNLHGEFQLLNGNQTGAILIYYLLKMDAEKGLMGNEFIAKTIVTSDLLSVIAQKFGVKSYETLTGFKYIAELIRSKEGSEKYIAGGEESYGYMFGNDVRDKDAVASCALLSEACGWAKYQNKTLFDLLQDIYIEHGYYLESLQSLTKKGASGSAEIQKIMSDLRANPPLSLGGEKVTQIIDYQSSTSLNVLDGSTKHVELAKSNVLQFITENGSKISLRPSGTEPKIKFYFSVNTKLPSKDEYDQTTFILKNRLDSLQRDLIR